MEQLSQKTKTVNRGGELWVKMPKRDFDAFYERYQKLEAANKFMAEELAVYEKTFVKGDSTQ